MLGRIRYLLLAVLAGLLLLSANLVQAQSGGIEVVSSSANSEFPLGMRFRLEVRSVNEIEEVAVRFRIGEQARGEYNYLEVDQVGQLAHSELFFRTNTGARYIPPGTIIRYTFEILDVEGNQHNTDQKEFIYEDARFLWEEISEGAVAVAYHGPVKRRAEAILDAIVETNRVMGPIIGADTTEPIRVTVYNSVVEMLDALPPASAAIRRELITEGQAFVDVGTLLVLGGGNRPRGTASHEVMHILSHRAGDSIFRRLPSWLGEGLSELANLEPGDSYDRYLDFAIANDRLLPITSMSTLPGDPTDVIIFYGQARSIVQHMVHEYGTESMRDLMAAMKVGDSVDDAIQDIYGISRVELENEWRDTLGAPEFVPPNLDAYLPTSIPTVAIELFTFDSLRDTGTRPTPAAGEAPTPTVEPSLSPIPLPTVPVAIAATSEPEGEPTTEPEPLATTHVVEEGQSTGGACGAPVNGGPVEISLFGVLLGLAGLGYKRRSRKIQRDGYLTLKKGKPYSLPF